MILQSNRNLILNYLKPLNEPVWDNIQVREPCVRADDSTFGFERAVSMTCRRHERALNCFEPLSGPTSDNIQVRAMGHRSQLRNRTPQNLQISREQTAQDSTADSSAFVTNLLY
jgi:hypothetical protein